MFGKINTLGVVWEPPVKPKAKNVPVVPSPGKSLVLLVPPSRNPQAGPKVNLIIEDGNGALDSDNPISGIRDLTLSQLFAFVKKITNLFLVARKRDPTGADFEVRAMIDDKAAAKIDEEDQYAGLS
ncbi:uncharacterized protein PAC_15827 [Phialocephala subalpina]|uniref:Uncharacterized protein n=1 Tax=Phialocephala subalpina TaxID=576137 RepID=A0A1L7XLV7_9HELO|nr:uncharacterized protein PAC_15827 [Phialocephala subalpina]